MIDNIESLMRKLPAPPPGRSPAIACVLGVLLGGLGLAIYLKNVVDFVLPVLMVIILSIFLGADVGIVGGALFAGLYGYFRVGVFIDNPTEPPGVSKPGA